MITAANVRLHLARHSSPPVPGAVTRGYLLLKDAKVASGIPVAAFRILLGTCITGRNHDSRHLCPHFQA
jgi:hypothetical protein